MSDKTLVIRVAADTSGLDSEFQKAIRTTNELGGAFSRVAKSQGVELSNSLERNVKQLEILRDHLVTINAPASDVEKVTLKLTEAQKKLDQALSDSSVNAGKFGGVLQQHGAAIGATLTAIGAAAFGFANQSLTAFEESEISIAQLENVIRSTGGVAEVTKDEVLNLAAAIQKQTGISDEAVTTAQSMLLSFTKIGHDIFPDVTHAVVDFATFMNRGAVPSMEQMQTAAIKIGKAMQSPVEGVAALQKAGVRLSVSQQELVKDLVSVGKTAEAQAIVLKELQKEFGGAGNAAGKTFAGQVSTARNEMNDFQEVVGGKIVPVLQSLMKDFPTTAKGAVLLSDSIGGLSIRAGDLLVALPLMKTAFGGMGLSSIASGFSGIGSAIGLVNPAALAAATGLGAFLVAYAAIAKEQSVNTQLKETVDLMEKVLKMGKLGIGQEGLIALKAQAADLARALGETRTEAEIFTALVQNAVKDGIKPLTGEIGLWVSKQGDLKTALDYTRPSLEKQIAAMEKEVAVMKAERQEKDLVFKKEDELNVLKKKLTETIEKETEAHKKIAAEIKSLTTKELPGYEKSLADIDAKWKGIVSNKDIKSWEVDRATAAKNLAIQLNFVNLQLKLQAEGNKDLKRVLAEQEKEREDQLTLYSKLYSESLAELIKKDKVTTSAIDKVWDDSYKTRGAARLASAVNEREKIIIQYQLDLEEFQHSEEAKILLLESRATYEEKLAALAAERDAKLAKESIDAAKKVSDVWSKQVSTIVTDLGKGIADAIIEWKGFGESMTKIAKEFGKSVLRMLVESMFNPLMKKGGFLDQLSEKLGGLFGKIGSPGTGVSGAGGLFSSLVSGIPLFGAGIGAALLGNRVGGGVGGQVSGAAIGGLGSAVGATALVSGIGTGGGFASSMAGISGLLGAIPVWGWAALGAAMLAGPVINKLTQRGRDKTTATGGAEEVSADVWATVGDVKSGNLTVDEGAAAVKQYWANYESFLRANLKDQTVIQRSLDTQRITLTEGLAAIEAFRVDSYKGQLLGVIAEFGRTGAISQEFSDLIVKLGGNIVEFKTNIADISKLEGLRNGFAGLRDELVKLTPATEDMFQVFMRTGEVTDDLKKAIEATGGTARAQGFLLIQLKQYAKATDDLSDFTKGIGSLRDGLASLAPATLSAYQSFLDLNKITPDLRAEVEKFGLDIKAFESFSAIKSLKDQFASLKQTILETGEGADALKSIFASVGADTTVLDSAGNIKALKAQQDDFAKLQTELARINPTPAMQSEIDQFIQSGQMSEQFIQKLRDMGADVSKFSDFQGSRTTKSVGDSLVAEFQKTQTITQEMRAFAEKFGQTLTGTTANMAEQMRLAQQGADNAYRASAAALSTEVGKLQTSITSQILALQTALETALTAVGTTLDTQFETSRLALIGQLDLLDTNLTGAVNSARSGLITTLNKIDFNLGTILTNLKNDLTTAVNNLTGAISRVAVPGTPAAVIQPVTNPTVPITDRSLLPRNLIDRTLRVTPMARGGSGTVSRPTLFLAGEAGAEDYEFTPRGKRKRRGATIQQINHFVVDDFAAQRRLLDRVNRNLVRQLS